MDLARRRFRSLPYRLHVPAAAPPPAGFPLLLFLHGAGERGDDNEAQLRHGVAPLLAAGARQLILVAPQCPAGARWVEVDWDAPSHRAPAGASGPLGDALDLLAALERQQPVDARRRYVTGLSMGGFGAWDAVTRHPRRFAACAPVCGGGDARLAPLIAHLPVWAFHGSDDDVVPVSRSREMVAALRAAGGQPRYSEYAGVGHDCWERAYAEPALLPWLLSQALP